MTTLSTSLLDPTVRPQVVDALVQLAETEVSGKKGISGTMLKTALAGARKAPGGGVGRPANALLPGVARALDPHFEAKGSQPFGAYLADPARSSQVADELLAVADARARSVEGNPLGKLYASFRGRAKEHVVAALPGLGATLERFVR
ncbi:DUF6918 family protein [Ornithinimicrobium pratense]|uniref:Uncharacterized protein n=1 Tax=Ornithinimicrobium pratense TaxID=2593973 RepID=A0A5J6V1Q1_9MICO|nr:hypothetical protein [Ornithinimicrobium pratense]QFG67750.1 hypothetical protein FY030_02520 [Ornithinimicrobium pratense]